MPVLTVRRLLVTSAIALAACSGLETSKLAFNRYTLETPYGDGIAYATAVASLEREADDICAAGYRKTNDYDTEIGGGRRLVWEITCRGVERVETRLESPSARKK